MAAMTIVQRTGTGLVLHNCCLGTSYWSQLYEQEIMEIEHTSINGDAVVKFVPYRIYVHRGKDSEVNSRPERSTEPGDGIK